MTFAILSNVHFSHADILLHCVHTTPPNKYSDRICRRKDENREQRKVIANLIDYQYLLITFILEVPELIKCSIHWIFISRFEKRKTIWCWWLLANVRIHKNFFLWQYKWNKRKEKKTVRIVLLSTKTNRRVWFNFNIWTNNYRGNSVVLMLAGTHKVRDSSLIINSYEKKNHWIIREPEKK